MTILRTGLLVAALALPVSAFANQTVIQGVEFDSRGYTLPGNLCAYPGQWLRLGAMVTDPYGRPGVPPAEYVNWRVTQTNNGNFIDWSPGASPARGPFRRDNSIRNAILLATPRRGPVALQLDAIARGARLTRIRIVDPRRAPCQWGPQGMYSSQGPGPRPVPPTPPPPYPYPPYEFEGQVY